MDWSVADHDGEPTNLDLPGDGNYQTSPVTLSLGCHTYYELLTINGRPAATNAEQPGQASETLLITPPGPPTPTPTPDPTPTPSSTPSPSPSSGPPSTPTASSPRPTMPAPSSPQPPTVAGGGHSLAHTGTNTARALALALAAIGLGGLALLSSRRRGAHRASR